MRDVKARHILQAKVWESWVRDNARAVGTTPRAPIPFACFVSNVSKKLNTNISNSTVVISTTPLCLADTSADLVAVSWNGRTLHFE